MEPWLKTAVSRWRNSGGACLEDGSRSRFRRSITWQGREVRKVRGGGGEEVREGGEGGR